MTRSIAAAVGAFAMAVVPLAALAEPSVDIQTRCFQFTGQPDKLMQLRLIATADGNEAAFVRYRGAKAWLPLVLSRRKQVPQADSGRSEVDTEWLEVAPDQVTGRYALGMLGNEVTSFDYVNSKTGRRTTFDPAPTPRGVDPCDAR